jgi:hypothetical protein
MTDAKIVQPHEDLVDDDYHEWVSTAEKVRADITGRPNPRMYQANWTKWVCNNLDCAAFALVSDELSLAAIRAVEKDR